MGKIAITTDSGIDPINENNMVPLQIIKNDQETFKDIVEISPKEIIDGLKQGDMFKTSSPIITDYQDKFEEELENGNDIIHLSLGSGISEGSVNASNLVANMVNEDYDNQVYVIDTLTGATGGTLINEVAKDYVKKGYPIKEIVDKLNEIKTKIKTSFYVPSPEGFIRSGRNKSDLCLKDKALLLSTRLAKKAGIKFRVDINDEGNLYAHSIIRENKKSGMLKLVKNIINDSTIELYDPNYVVIGNILEKDVSMEEIKDYLRRFNYFKTIINKNINGVVAAYGSEDLCGISLIKK